MGSTCMEASLQNDVVYFVQENASGLDNRKQATEYDMLQQYCKIGMMIFINPKTKQKRYATAFPIRQNILLTSAHSFLKYNEITKTLELFQPVTFYFQTSGAFKDKEAYGVISYQISNFYKRISETYQYKEYYNLKESAFFDLLSHDYAIVKINRNITPFNPPKLLQDYNPTAISKPKSNQITIFGYSQWHFESNQDNQIIGAKILGHRHNINKIVNNQIEHTVTTSNGTSGSPIYVCLLNKGNIQEYYCIGLHSGSLKHSNIKYGTLLSSSLVKGIKQMQENMDKSQNRSSGVLEKQAKYNIYQICDKQIRQIQAYQGTHSQQQIKEQGQNVTHQSNKLIPSSFISLPITAPNYTQLQITENKEFTLQSSINPQIKSQEYIPFNFTFNFKTHESSYYETNKGTVSRKKDENFLNNKPFHLVSNQFIPKQEKSCIKIRDILYDEDQPIIIGFISSYRLLQNSESGLPKQEECVSLCTWRKKKTVKRKDNTLIRDDIECLGAILVDGEIQGMDEGLYLRESEGLTIYIDMKRQEIIWEFERSRYFRSKIPLSILNSQGMYFFVGLNNTKQKLVIQNIIS